MKKLDEHRLNRINIFAGLLAIIIAVQTCKPVEQVLKVKVETGTVSSVGFTFAVIEGILVDVGDGNIEQHGFCYGTTENPTIVDENTRLGSRSTSGSFSDSLENLQTGTKYYVRAYAIASDELYYGDQTTFTTLSPTSPVVDIESVGTYENDSAEIKSSVTDDGGSAVNARGVCWSLAENPTTLADHTVDGTGTGSFTSFITGLDPDTTYYFRAYATSAVVTSYSDQHQLTTPPVSIEITTTAIAGISITGAVSGGTVTAGEGAEVLARGVCWSTAENPDLTGSHTTDGTGVGSFSSSITGLMAGTTYYVRAYATSLSGTVYGNQLNFTTTSQSASLPVLTTTAVSSITEVSAVSGGNITDDGGSTVSARGACWSKSHNPDLSDAFTTDGTGTGSFISEITGLSSNTTYYARAYATNGEGTSYGSEVTFTTNQSLFIPTLTTAPVTSITDTSAISGGNITDNGGSLVTSRGVCWSTSQNPEVTDNKTSDGSGSGTFVSTVSELAPNTTYNIRAYAINGIGTSYGNQVSFNTGQTASLPTLTTAVVSGITELSAESGGNITDNGGSSILARGVCWSISHNPVLGDSYTTDGIGTGSYTSSITGLSSNTTYYVRAYATNESGTAYGSEVSFTTNTSLNLPTLTTLVVSNITANSAKSGGSISDDGGSSIIARGVCWSTTTSPDLSDNITSDGSSTGSFISTLIGLTPNTKYYIRAYATNSAGTSFGNEFSFTTMDLGETVTDFDGNVYQTVVIGTQTWMAKNLKTTRYSNGDPIPQYSDILDWVGATEGAYCYFDNDYVTYGEIYGALYNWYAVDDTRNICPDGWHVPSAEEWNVLVEFAGGSTVAGAKLKEEGGMHWPASSYGTNEFGFTALPANYRDDKGKFQSITPKVTWWTTSLIYSLPAAMYIYYNDYDISEGGFYSITGNSIRCLKD